MYKCSECNTEYEVKPEFCECGNDQFIEVTDVQEDAQAYTNATPSSIFEQNSTQPQEYVEDDYEEKFSFDASVVKKRKITIMLLVMSMVVSVLLFIFVGNTTPKPRVDTAKQAEIEAQKEKLAQTIPNVETFWDDTPAYRVNKSNKGSSLPLLNDKLNSLSPELRKFMVSIGNEFAKNWSQNTISGSGICVIEFTIDKNGVLDKKKIYNKSDNDTLNDSVLMALSKVASVEAPPADYKGERIRLSFEINDNGTYKIRYP